MTTAKKENLTDEFTSKLMHIKYGKRFDKCSNLKEDNEMNRDWDKINTDMYYYIDQYIEGNNVEVI